MSKKTAETKPAEPETEEVEELEETEVDEENGTEDEDDEEEVEETVSKKDLEKVQEVNTKLRAENKEKAAEVRRLTRELKKAQEQKPEDVDSAKLVDEANKTASKFKDIAVRKEATLALNEAGAKVSTKRLLKLLDLADVEIDDDGNVEGLADAITELKDESPEFFKSDDDEEETKPVKKVATVRKPGTVDAGKKTPPQPKPLSAAEQMAKAAVGRR